MGLWPPSSHLGGESWSGGGQCWGGPLGVKQDLPEPRGFSSPLSAEHREPPWTSSSQSGKALHPHPTAPLALAQQELSSKKRLAAEETKASLCHALRPLPGMVKVKVTSICSSQGRGISRAARGLGKILSFLHRLTPTCSHLPPSTGQGPGLTWRWAGPGKRHGTIMG